MKRSKGNDCDSGIRPCTQVVYQSFLGQGAIRMTGAPPSRRSPIARHYEVHFQDARRERLFLASVSFFATFAVVRAITHAIHAGVGPFRNIAVGGMHLHHLVWGILLLLFVGYLWLVQFGTGGTSEPRWRSRATALAYGAAAALTLDEFALWLRLQDVYWAREGRASVDAVILFGALLSIGLVGRRFFVAILREMGRLVHLS